MARNLIESFGPSENTGLIERTCGCLCSGICSLTEDEEMQMYEEGGAETEPAVWGFDEIINPAGEAQRTCSGCPSVTDCKRGKAMLLVAAFPSEWTSGEDLACDEEEEQACESGGTSQHSSRTTLQ